VAQHQSQDDKGGREGATTENHPWPSEASDGGVALVSWRVWFVYREWRSVKRMLGGIEMDYASARDRYLAESKRIREGTVRLMYGDCVEPARTYRKTER
jgi:hypothetical protein